MTLVGSDRVALGAALAGRVDAIGTEVASIFPGFLCREAFASARLATELIGRWVATGRAADLEEELALSRQGQRVVLMEVDLAIAVRGYLRWRDLCTAAIHEEGARLDISLEVIEMASRVVRLSCDSGLVRTVRAFDETRNALRERLSQEQVNLSKQTLYDDLTGLPNRVLLSDRLRRAADSANRTASSPMLLSLDLDNFTAVNDRFGHASGDGVLVIVAERLLKLVRASDTVARLSGDAFVILAEDLDEPMAAAQSLAERIHQTMRAPIAVGEVELHASVSIGITTVPVDADPEVCLARADAAMQQARRSGPAYFEMYAPSAGEDSRRDELVSNELRVAHGNGELTLDYQPIFRMAGGRPAALVGMEALLRWTHPELGAIAPNEFVPLLEQSRQIVPVGRWVLEEAAFQCRDWQAQGFPDLTMSVNVSARQLQDPGFVDDVQDALEGSGLAADRLMLEVTESVLVVDIIQIGATMQRVRDLGVHLALDDFGTGYSSLLYLQGLPIDRLKIDRSFVAGLGSMGNDGTILQTVVDLAHSLGITVIAEGVETLAELRAVGAIGCDESQGFLLGRPAPAHLHALDQIARSTILTA